MILDQPADDPIKRLACPYLLGGGRHRNKPEKAASRGKPDHQCVHRHASLFGPLGYFRAEKRLSRDFQSQVRHFPLNIARLSWLPVLEHLLRQDHDFIRITLHQIAMERGLANLPVMPPGAAVAGDKPVAQYPAYRRRAQPGRLDKVMMIRDQNSFDVGLNTLPPIGE